MTFCEQLQSAAGQLTAAQIAEATSASIGTAYAWRHGRRKPKAREQAGLLTRIRRARARHERRQGTAMQAPNVVMSDAPLTPANLNPCEKPASNRVRSI